MRKSEWQRLKTMIDNGEPKETILEAMEPRKRGNGHKAPEGGISLRAAARKYSIPEPTLSRKVKAGYVKILLRTKNWLYIDENSLKKFLGQDGI